MYVDSGAKCCWHYFGNGGGVVSEWIDVNEILPDEVFQGLQVIVCVELPSCGLHVMPATFHHRPNGKSNFKHRTNQRRAIAVKVTHWMRMPSPPTAKQ